MMRKRNNIGILGAMLAMGSVMGSTVRSVVGRGKRDNGPAKELPKTPHDFSAIAEAQAKRDRRAVRKAVNKQKSLDGTARELRLREAGR